MFKAAICCVVAALSSSNPAWCRTLPETWVMRTPEGDLMSLSVNRGQKPQVVWRQPLTYRTDGFFFKGVKGPVVEKRSIRTEVNGGVVTAYFKNPFAGAPLDKLTLRTVSACEASLSWSAFPKYTYVVQRSDHKNNAATAVPDSGTAVPIMKFTSHASIKRVFDEDQKVRQNFTSLDWNKLRAEDANRRKLTEKLLDAGELESGTDFYYAAYVFQHGYSVSDYMKAHAFALIAMARGRPDAIWISAASLDRLLQELGKGQVYGTQYLNPSGKQYTQEPFDRTSLNDRVRALSNVPDLAAQEVERLRLTKESTKDQHN